MSRHGTALLRHLTPARLANAALLALELASRRTHVRSRPVVIKIEPTNICNFRCPGCRTGSGEDTSPRGMISFENYQQIIDCIRHHAFKVILYMWGEPFLHKDVFRMIRYAADRNLSVQVSSNMNAFREGYAEMIVDSGLEHLIVAMDGISQETYEKYRVGGSIDKVVRNVQMVVKAREKRRSRLPIVELQYILFPHNRHELEGARTLARGLGVDRFTIIDTISNTDKGRAKLKNGVPRQPDKCNTLWTMACVNWDGSLSPCCDSVDDSFGNVLEENLDSLWNSEKMRKSRSLQGPSPTSDGPKTKCSLCRIYGSYVTFAPDRETSPADTPATATTPRR